MKLRSRLEAVRKGRCVSVRVRVIAVLSTLLPVMAVAGRAAAAPPATPPQATSSPRDTAAVPGGWLKQVQGEVQKHEYDLSWQAAPVVERAELTNGCSFRRCPGWCR